MNEKRTSEATSALAAGAAMAKASGKTKKTASKEQGNEQVQKLVKALHYIGGLTEASETMIFFLLICLFPQFFAIFGVFFALLCLITTGTRAYAGWRDFGNDRAKKI